MAMPENWIRFQETCHLVHSMVVYGDMVGSPTISTAASMTPSPNLFPNLHRLRFEGVNRGRVSAFHKEFDQFCAVFMHAAIQEFSASFSSELKPGIDQYALHQTIVSISRMPMLVHLEIDSEGLNTNQLLNVIQDFQHLENITLPRFHLCDNVIERLSTKPFLARLTTTKNGPRDPVRLTPLELQFSDGSYRALCVITLAGNAQSIARLLRQPFFPSKLTGLHLDMQRQQSPNEVRSLLDCVVSTCGSSIKELVFHDYDHHRHYQAPMPRTWEDIVISLDTLKPFLGCAQLTTLEIRHNYPLAFRTRDWEVVASSFPSIENLYLNEVAHEIIPQFGHLPKLDVIAVFARHCPKLVNLGLLVEASDTKYLRGRDRWPVMALKSLSVGESYIRPHNEEAVALFLARVLSRGCQITSRRQRDDSGWGLVNRMVAVIFLAKQQT